MTPLFLICTVILTTHPPYFGCLGPMTQEAATPMMQPRVGPQQLLYELHVRERPLSQNPKLGVLDENGTPEQGRVLVCSSIVGADNPNVCPVMTVTSEDKAAQTITREKARAPARQTNFVVYDLVRVKY